MSLWNWILDLFCDAGASVPPKALRGEDGTVATVDAEQPSAGDLDQDRARVTERWWAPDGVLQTEPLPVFPPPMSAEARALENLLVSHFDGHDINMPAMPRVAERVLSRLRDPRSSMAKVAEDIAEDQVMAGDVLRMANSAMYRGLNKIKSVQAAVTRLGANTLRTLMMHQTMRAAMFHKRGVNQERADMLWRRSLASAGIMRGLARFVAKDEEDAFLIGLLHDVGNVLVLRLIEEQRHVTHHGVDLPTFEYLAYECHQEFGELIAGAWSLPDALKALISNHHMRPAEGDPLATERWMLMLTDMINQMLGYDVDNSYNLLDAAPVHALGLAERPGFEEFLAELPEQIDETIAAFHGG